MPPVSAFIGRDEESARLREMAVARPLVTVVGPGGMGKTRLATEVMSRLAGEFPAGIHYCELASIATRDRVEAEIAGHLGFPSLEALITRVGDDPALIVLDNCEHLLAAVARVSARLLDASPTLHLLATSREPLGVDGEQLFVLGPLGLPATAEADQLESAPAAQLFADRARASGASWEDSEEQRRAIVELCRRLDGVPLAIELAAARARAMTPVELLAHLDRRFQLLRRDGPVGRARHKSLRAAIDASYHLLEPGEQAFFRALGVFTAPFETRLAHGVAAAPDADVLDTADLLARLVDRSLTVADQQSGVTRYRLLESLRDYACEQAKEAGEWEAAMDRFVGAMVGEADRVLTVGLARWSARVLDDVLTQLENLIAAVDRCIDVDAAAERAFRLLLPTWGAIHQGRAGEVAAMCDRVFARWPHGEEPLRAEASAVAANTYLVAGSIDRACELARAALDAPASTDLARIISLRTLGMAARQQGDAAAAARFAAARDVAREAGIVPFERELGALVAAVDEGTPLDDRLAYLADLADRAAADGDSISEVWARSVTAQLLVRAGRTAEAATALAIAERLQEEFEYPYGKKLGRRLRAVLATLDHGWAAARPAWREAIDHTAAAGDLAELALTLRSGSAMAREAGDHDAADAMLSAIPRGVHVNVLGDPLPERFGSFVAATGRAELAAPTPASVGHALRRLRSALAPQPPGVAETEAAAVEPARDVGTRDVGAPDAAARDAHARDGGARGSVSAHAARAPGAGDGRAAGALLRDGDGWRAGYAGREVRVRHLKGLDDLGILLARPEQEVHCLELMGSLDLGGDGGSGPGIDDRARREYRARIRDLQSEIDAALSANDSGRAERAEAELDALVGQLSEAFGLGGRPRATGSAVERARSAVTWRIRAAIKRVGEVHPELGRHLGNAVRTGTWCVYRPEVPVAWETSRG